MEWNNTSRLWLIILCFIIGLIPRYLPLLFFRKRQIPKWFDELMGYVPIALFMALVSQSLFMNQSYQVSFVGKAPILLGALLTIAVAYWTRSMMMSVFLGLAVVFLLSIVL